MASRTEGINPDHAVPECRSYRTILLNRRTGYLSTGAASPIS